MMRLNFSDFADVDTGMKKVGLWSSRCWARDCTTMNNDAGFSTCQQIHLPMGVVHLLVLERGVAKFSDIPLQ